MGTMLSGSTWAERVLRAGFALCLGLSSVLVLVLVMELSAPEWSRMAILLQCVALLLGSSLMLIRRRRSPRWLLYPVALAVTVYMWDTTLPPPNLPEGFARGLVPRLVLLSILADALLTIRHQRRFARAVRAVTARGEAPSRAIPVRNGLVPVTAIAELFQITPNELVARLHRHGRRTVATSDRGPSLWLADLMLLLKHWHEDDGAEGQRRHQR